MAIHSNGLYYGTPSLGRLRPDMGDQRPIHQDGTLSPLRMEGKTAEDLAVIFAQEVWKYHGLPADIVSDCNSRST